MSYADPNISEADPASQPSIADYSLIIGGIAAALASIIYSLKHVKSCNSCCGLFACNQDTNDCPETDNETLEKIIIHKYIDETSL